MEPNLKKRIFKAFNWLVFLGAQSQRFAPTQKRCSLTTRCNDGRLGFYYYMRGVPLQMKCIIYFIVWKKRGAS